MKNFRLIAPDGRYGDGIFGDFLKIAGEIFGGYWRFLYFCDIQSYRVGEPSGPTRFFHLKSNVFISSPFALFIIQTT